MCVCVCVWIRREWEGRSTGLTRSLLLQPTNHLDFESINAIEEALSDYKGGVVLVSHDQHLVSTLAAASTHAAQLLVVGRGRVRDITARGYAAYVESLNSAVSKRDQMNK